MTPPRLPSKAAWTEFVKANGLRAGTCDVCGEFVRIVYRGETAFLCETCLEQERQKAEHHHVKIEPTPYWPISRNRTPPEDDRIHPFLPRTA